MDAFVLVYTNKSKKEADTTPESDFADLECEVSAKSVTGTKYEGTVT